MGRLDLPPGDNSPRSDRDRRAQLEHVLIEEVAQELTRILRILAAVRSPSLSTEDVGRGLGRIADLLGAAILHCTTAAKYFDQPLLPSAPPGNPRKVQK